MSEKWRHFLLTSVISKPSSSACLNLLHLFPVLEVLDLLCRFFYYYHKAGIAQLVEYKLPKLGAAGSIPVARSKIQSAKPTYVSAS